MSTQTQLSFDAGGRWQVRTASGTVYHLDLDAGTLTRMPATAPAASPGSAAGSSRSDAPGSAGGGEGGWISERLRRDGETLPLRGFIDGPLQLGDSAYFLLGEVDDYAGYVQTTRQTTPLTEIRALAAPEV